MCIIIREDIVCGEFDAISCIVRYSSDKTKHTIIFLSSCANEALRQVIITKPRMLKNWINTLEN